MPDIAGDSSTTSSIAVGSAVTGSIEVVSDHDWFRIDLVAGQSITIVLNGVGTTPLGDPYLRIRDAAGNLIAQNDDGGPGLNSLLSFTASATGTYYIDVSEYDSGVGDYQLQVNPFTPPPVASVNQFATQLASGYWDGNSHHFNVTQGGNLSVNLTGLTTTGQNLARLALRQWGDVIGISFVEVSSGGQILFDDDQTGASSSSTYSNGIISQSRVNVSVQWLTDYGSSINSYGFQTYVHEIGHALGLGHAGNYNSEATYATDALYANDGWPVSIMSYFSPDESSFYANQGFTRSYVTTPMIADIAAIGMLYGLSTTTRAGATTYGFNSNAGNVFNASLNPTVAYTVFDSSGIDTLDFSGFSQNQTIDLGQGQFSNVGGRIGTVAIAVGTIIENAIGGSGNDVIRGNAAANVLAGGSGNDIIRGDAGDDELSGDAGDDDLAGGSGVDQFHGGQGRDIVRYGDATGSVAAYMTWFGGNSGAAAGETFHSIEDLAGSAFADVLGGNALPNALYGEGGSDWIFGFEGSDYLVGGEGNDVLAGGPGNDLLDGRDGVDVAYYRDAEESVYNASLQGAKLGLVDGRKYGISLDVLDHVNNFGDAAYDQLINIENIWGSRFDDVIRGDDSIGGQVYGFEGNDILDGRGGDDLIYGGSGADTLTGGAGADDFFYLSHNDHYNQYGILEPFEGGDTITDFQSGVDHLIVSRYWFGFGNIPGPAAALTGTHAGFITDGSAPATSNPTFSYDPRTGTLMFDSDGNGSAAAVHIATLRAGATFTLSDIWTA